MALNIGNTGPSFETLASLQTPSYFRQTRNEAEKYRNLQRKVLGVSRPGYRSGQK